ncbi:AMP-dependent synthetase, partial [Mesorhizobium sp. M7A.F.Ca.CA.001.08.2.1]
MHGAVPLLDDYLSHSAERLGDKIALVCGEHRLTYDELETRSSAVARHLVTSGVAPGDRVMIFADNTVETVVSFWAVLKASAVVCVVNPLTKSDKLGYLLNDCLPAALITDKHLQPVFAEPARNCPSLRRLIVSGQVDDAELRGLPHAVRWDEAAAGHGKAPARRRIDIDLAAIIYTSGSTGEPKGVMLTHRNMMAACTSIASYLELGEDDVILNVLPLAFDYGLYQMIMAFRTGARLVLERSFAFPAQILAIIERERVTGFPGVPTIFAALSDLRTLKANDFASIRYVTNTAAALPLKHIRLL